jgi:prepilin-type N-terminal cleavage/methylation domain-containing protein
MADTVRKKAFTLVEILLAVAIVAILATILLLTSSGLRTQSQIKLTESTLAVISSALRQYHEFWGKYPPQYNDLLRPVATYDLSIDLPPAYYDPVTHAQTPVQAIAAAIDKDPGVVTFQPLAVTHADQLTSSEALYLYLSQTPACSKMILQVTERGMAAFRRMSDGSLTLVKKASYAAFAYQDDQTGASPPRPTTVRWGSAPAGNKDLGHFIDPWRTALRYEYKTGDQYPVVRSAGPDGAFGTPDDIRSGGL